MIINKHKSSVLHNLYLLINRQLEVIFTVKNLGNEFLHRDLGLVVTIATKSGRSLLVISILRQRFSQIAHHNDVENMITSQFD
jgi:hypothetical protein